MRNAIVALITAGLFVAGSAEAGCRVCSLEFNVYNSSNTEIAQPGGGAYVSYGWTCEGQETEREAKVVYDQSRNENIPEGTVEIFVYPTNPMHPLSLEFEVEVEKLCSEQLGEPSVITDRRELVPAHDAMPLKPWEIDPPIEE